MSEGSEEKASQGSNDMSILKVGMYRLRGNKQCFNLAGA